MTSDMRQKVDLLITAGCIVTVDAERRILFDGAIAVEGSNIVAVGPRAELMDIFAPARHIDEPEGLVVPGFIDAHTHPIDSLIPGMCDDTPQFVRLSQRVIPYEDQLDDEDAFLAAKASFIEMIRHGTTTFVDGAGPQPDAIARAAIDTGIRGVITRKLTDVAGPFGGRVEALEDAIAGAEETVAKYRGGPDSLIRAAYNIDMPIVASDALLSRVAEASAARGVGVVSHLIGRQSLETTNSRNADIHRLQKANLLGPDLLLAHIGWIPKGDVELLAATDTQVAHCPGSSFVGGNGWVSHGVIPDLVAAGANVALGTDASIISRSLDMVRTMYLAACAHKDARQDPLIMNPFHVFEMATIGGARAARWSDRIGSLEAGKAADLAIFDISGPEWWPDPLGNAVPNLVYGGSGRDARTVVINGIVAMENRQFPQEDLQTLAKAVDKASRRALTRLGGRRVTWPPSPTPQPER